MTALDRIQRVKLLDVQDGDLLLLEVDTSTIRHEAGDANPLDELSEVVRAELDRIGRSNVGVLIASRGMIDAKIVRAG